MPALRRGLCRVAVALVALALTTPLTIASAATSAPAAPATGLLFGAYLPPFEVQRGPGTDPAATDASLAADQFEQRLGRKLDLRRSYLRWDDSDARLRRLRTSRVAAPRSCRSQPLRRDGARCRWAVDRRRRAGRRLIAQATAVAALGAPVFLAFHHEPDAVTGYGTPAEFRAA